MRQTTQKIKEILKGNYLISNEQWEQIDNVIDQDLKSTYIAGTDAALNPCGCGQPSCSICN